MPCGAPVVRPLHAGSLASCHRARAPWKASRSRSTPARRRCAREAIPGLPPARMIPVLRDRRTRNTGEAITSPDRATPKPPEVRLPLRMTRSPAMNRYSRYASGGMRTVRPRPTIDQPYTHVPPFAIWGIRTPPASLSVRGTGSPGRQAVGAAHAVSRDRDGRPNHRGVTASPSANDASPTQNHGVPMRRGRKTESTVAPIQSPCVRNAMIRSSRVLTISGAWRVRSAMRLGRRRTASH